jgi:hypothetical protein
MSEPNLVIPATHAPAVSLSSVNFDSSDKPKWIQIAYEGEWKGHHTGAFRLTREHFDECVKNLHAHPAYEPGGASDVVPFDFDHASEIGATSGSKPLTGSPAQGWVRELEVRTGPDGKAQLWSLTNVLEPARTYLREKKLKWVSAAIWFNAVDHVTNDNIGAMLTSVAWTNKPFLRALPAIAANLQPHTAGKPMLTKSVRLLALLNLTLDATEENITTEVEKLKTENATLKADLATLRTKDADADVTLAMQTYQIQAPLRPAMLSMRLSDPAGFERHYPKPVQLTAEQALLMQRVTPPAPAGAYSPPMPPQAPPQAFPPAAHQPHSSVLANMAPGPGGQVIYLGNRAANAPAEPPAQGQPPSPTSEFVQKLLTVPGNNKFERAMNFIRAQPGGEKLTHEDCHTQAGLMLSRFGIPRHVVDVTELVQTG